MIFENFLAACSRFRKVEVLAEAFAYKEPKHVPAVQPKPRQKRAQPPPGPPPAPTTPPIPTSIDTFTDQQMTKGDEILARINQRKTA